MRYRWYNKKLPNDVYCCDISKWLAQTRQRLLTTGWQYSYDEKWSRIKRHQCFSVDHTLLSFDLNIKWPCKEILLNNKQKIWVSLSGLGLKKGQCTIQVLTRAGSEQPKIAIIFRGTGKCVTEGEKPAWQLDLEVYWQGNAWTDTLFSIKWVEKILSKSVTGLDCFVLYLDNLTAQETDVFQAKVESLNGIV